MRLAVTEGRDDTVTATDADGQARGRLAKLYASFEPGAALDRFTITEKLGEGGMGIVVAAHDPELDREVAIKLLHTRLVTDRDHEHEPSQRLRREAQAMAKLSHDNVVTVHEVGETDGRLFIVMELVDGGTLSEWLETPRPWRDTLAVLERAGRGLAAAHEQGLVHRDFKPDNVLITRDGRVRVSDFGLVSTSTVDVDVLADTVDPTNLEVSPMMQMLTRTGAILGTPRFMSPEQHAGKRCTDKSDQFAFCVSLYRALYGEYPFAGDTLAELAASVAESAVRPPPKDSDVPARVFATIERGLAAQPSNRFESMDALLDELAQHGAPAKTKTGLVAGVGLAAAVAIGVGVFASVDDTAPAPPAVAPIEIPAELTDRAITTVVPPQELVIPILTRDGARLAYQPYPRGPIVVHDIDEGEPRTVPRPEARSFALLDFFPDGKALVGLLRLTGGGLYSFDLDTEALVPLPSPSGVPRGRTGPKVSPDGKYILYPARTGIRVLAVDGSGDELIVPLPRDEEIMDLTWSPDGSAVAFVRYRTAHASGRFLLQIARRDGSGVEQLSDTDSYKHTVEWSEPGQLFYDASTDGKSAIWVVAVADARFVGEPVLVREFGDVDAVPWLRKRGDKLFYVRYGTQTDAYLVDYAPADNGVAPSWSPLASGVPVRWLPDGRITYRDNVGLYALVPGGEATLMVKRGEDELVDSFEIPAEGMGGADLYWLWQEKTCTLMRLDDGARTAEAVMEIARPEDGAAECPTTRCASDAPGVCIALVASSGELHYHRLDLVGGALGEVLHRAEGRDNRTFLVSPDGKRIIYPRERVDQPAVVVVDLETGSTVAHATNAFIPHDLGHLPGKDGWLATGTLRGHEPDQVLVELAPRAEPRVLHAHTTQLHDPLLSPDGRFIATFASQQRRNVWVLEGFE